MDLLEEFLEGKNYIAGTDNLTIADIYLYTEVAQLVYLAGYGLDTRHNTKRWFDLIDVLPAA